MDYKEELHQIAYDVHRDTEQMVPQWLFRAFYAMGADADELFVVPAEERGEVLTVKQVQHVLLLTFAFLAWSEPSVENTQLRQNVEVLEQTKTLLNRRIDALETQLNAEISVTDLEE